MNAQEDKEDKKIRRIFNEIELYVYCQNRVD